jgi:anti-sigma B factor antagonist
MSFDPTGFAISTSEQGGRTVVLVQGELDLATAPQLEEVVTERLAAGDEVVLDLRELAFMDSTGLRVLVRAHASVADERRFLVVRPPPGGPIAKILSIAGVDSQLDLVDDV